VFEFSLYRVLAVPVQCLFLSHYDHWTIFTNTSRILQFIAARMSSPSSSAKVVRKSRAPSRRSPSASEIARNVGNFEVWSTHQCCEQVAYSDIPQDFKDDVTEVYDVTGRLPTAWVDKNSPTYRALSRIAPKALLAFICDAYDACPNLFSDAVDPEQGITMFTEIPVVFSAWERLQRMRKSREKWSEADYVANVYNVFRSPALHGSMYRVHPTISLPQPPLRTDLSSGAKRILNTKTVIPDSAIFLPTDSVRQLSETSKSPYRTIKHNPSVMKTGSPSRASSFRYQTTPCTQIPDQPVFEFISSFWEDKKPVHNLLEDAYRQNRMATASAARHLHSLGVNAPVLGLVWASGGVRSHVDWCSGKGSEHPTVYSAPYPGEPGQQQNGYFREWRLDRPCDILQVYLLIRNIDNWTVGKFRSRVLSGVKNLAEDVKRGEREYLPWKRTGDLKSTLASRRQRENISVSTEVFSSISSPEAAKGKGKGRSKS